MGERVTTYKQNTYYLRVKDLLLTDKTLVCVMMKTYKCTFEEIFQSKKDVSISILYYQSAIC